MDKIDIGKLKTDSKDKLLQICFDRFGTMQKTEYESALFHVLMLNGYGDKTDFELSRMLKISETRVRNLRYKCSLEYPIDEDYNEQLRKILMDATYKWDGNKIQFCIPDKMLRLYTNNLLVEKNSFSDSSFNSSIVLVSSMDLMEILKTLYDTDKKEGKSEYEDLCKTMLKSLNLSDQKLPKTKADKLKESIFALANDLGAKVSPELSKLLVGYLKDYMEKKSTK